MDQKTFTMVTGVTRKYEDIVEDFKVYGDEAEKKLKERVKAWVGEGKVFDCEIDAEKYPHIAKAQEVLDAANVDYDLSEADVETGSTDSGSSDTPAPTPAPGSSDNGSYDDQDGSDDDESQGSNNG